MTASTPCPHPVRRLYAWLAYDDTLCVACCDCGAVLRGGASLHDDPDPGATGPADPDQIEDPEP